MASNPFVQNLPIQQIYPRDPRSFDGQNNNNKLQIPSYPNNQSISYLAQSSHPNNLNPELNNSALTISMEAPNMSNLNTSQKPLYPVSHQYDPAQYSLDGTFQQERGFEPPNKQMIELQPVQVYPEDLINPMNDLGIKKKQIQKSNTLRMGINEYELNLEQMTAAATMQQQKRMGRLSTLQQQESSEAQQNLDQKRFSKQNTISSAIKQSTNRQLYIYKERKCYHERSCCCNIYYVDDCCCKWIFDSIYYGLCGWIRLLLSCLRSCCYGVNSSDSDGCPCFFIEKCSNCLYAPFQMIGDWCNQCSFSFSNFCCDRDLNFLPSIVTNVFDGCCMRFCMSAGQFFKNCCLFPLDNCDACELCCSSKDGYCCVNSFCSSTGNCCQHCCSPQGFCEDLCSCLQTCFGGICSPSTVVEKCCCCCSEKNSIVIDGQVIGEIFKCCGCIISTGGELIVGIIGILGSILK